MKTLLSAVFALSCVAIFVLAGCDCGGESGTPDGSGVTDGAVDGGVVVLTPAIEFTQPVPDKQGKAILTPGDDQNPALDGIQYDVKVSTTNVETGRKVVLVNSMDPSKTLEAVVVVTDAANKKGGATFDAVTFKDGDNALTATVANAGGKTATKNMTVTANTVVDCVFTAPTEGQKFTGADDVDKVTSGFQYNVTVKCDGVEADNDVALIVNGTVAATKKIAGAPILYSGVTFAEGTNTLTVQAHNNAGRVAQVTPVHVTVDTGACLARINKPADGTKYLENGTGTGVVLDTDLATAGMQAAFEFETAYEAYNQRCIENAQVTWTITTPDGPLAAKTSQVAKDPTTQKYVSKLSLTIDEAAAMNGVPITIAAKVDETVGTDLRSGTALSVGATVDSVLPTATLTMPADNSYYNASMDLDNNPANGFQIKVKGTAGDVPDKAKVILMFDASDVGAVTLGADTNDEWTCDASLNCTFTFASVTIAPGQHKLRIHAVDASGNWFETPDITVTIDTSEPTIQFMWPTNGQTLLAADDKDGNPANGLQTDAISLVTQHVEDGQRGELRVTGQTPFAFTVTSNAAVFDDQYVTIPEGSAVTLEAVVSNKAGTQATQVPDPMQVSADIHAPTISFVQPTDGSTVDTSTVNVWLLMTGVENGQMVHLSVCDKDGANCVLQPDVAAANNRATFTDVPLATDTAAQPNTLKADVADKAGNPAVTAVAKVTVDQSVPVLTFQNPTDGATLVATDDTNSDLSDGLQYNVVVTATGVKAGDSGQLTITVNGKAGAPINSTGFAGGQFTWTNVTLPEGASTLTASYTSALNKTGSAQAGITVNTGRYVINITDPSDGTYLSAAADRDTNTAGVQVDVVAATDAAQGTACTLTIKHGSDTAIANAAADATGKVTFAFADVTLLDGVNTLKVHCSDGTKSGDSLVATVAVDQSAPTVSFVTPTDGQVYNLASVSSSFKTGFYVNVTVTGGAGGAALDDGSPGTLTSTLQSGQVVVYNGAFKGNQLQFKDVQIATDDYPAADKPTLKIEASDLAGNAAPPVTITLTVDRVAPVINVTNPTKTNLGIADDYNLVKADLQNSFNVTLTGGSVGQLVHLDITGATTYSTTQSVTNATTQNLAFPVDLKEGTSVVRIYTQDDAGNAADTGQISYVVDISVPQLQVFDKNSVELKDAQQYVWNKTYDTDAAAGFQGDFYIQTKGLKNSSTVRLCSNNTGGSGAVCDFGGGSYRVLAQGQVVVSGTFGSVTLKAITMIEGGHSMFAESRDDFGNKGQSGTFQVTVDNTPPTIASIVIDSNNPANDKFPDIMLGISEDADGNIANGLQAAITVTTTGVEDGQVLSLIDHGSTTIGTVAVSGNKAVFSAAAGNLVTLADGPHSLTASVSDKAGNPSAAATAVSIVADSTNPSLAFTVPAEYKGGAWLTQAACAAHPEYGCTQDGNNLRVNVVLSLSHTPALIGQVVHLTGGVAPADYTITGNTGGTVTFSQYALAQGVNNISASLADFVGNVGATTHEEDVNTVAATVAFVAPNNPSPGSPKVFTAADDKDGDPQNGLQTDQFVISVTGTTGNTTVEIQASPVGAGNFSTITNGTAAFSADNGNYAFNSAPYPTLAKGNRELRLKATDARANVTYSASIYVNVNLAVPAVAIEKATGDGLPGTADDLANGAKFLKTDATDTSGGVYKTTIQVASDVLSGTNARLWVNDVEKTPSVPLSGGKAAFTGVVLNQYPATNKLKAAVQDPTSLLTTTVEITGVLADGSAPTVAFTYPTPGGNPANADKVYTAANDADGNGNNGLQFNPSEQIAVSTSGVEDGQVATLSCTVGGGAVSLTGNTAVVSSNAATFGSLVLFTKHNMYDCTVAVSDYVGNAAPDPTHIYLQVDVVPPDDTHYNNASPSTGPLVCLGETTDSGKAEEKDHADCTSLCKTTKCSPSDYDAANCTCSRRRGHVTLAWNAPADDGTDATSGKARDYDVRWQKDDSVNHDCANFDWNTASSVGVEKDTIVDPGQVQTARVRGLFIHNYYCFAVVTTDYAGNTSSTNLAYARDRRDPFIIQSVATGGGGGFGNRVVVATLNNDSYPDIVASAPSANSNSGEVRVVYGNNAKPPVTISGPSGGWFGYSLAVGDFDGDGYDDILVGSLGVDGFAGRGFIYKGSASGITSTTASDPLLPSLQPDVVITGSAGSFLGWVAVNTRCNYNSDTNGATGKPFEDVVLGSLQNAYVFKGRTPFAGTIDVSAADMTLSHPPTSAGALRSISCGDVDKDGYQDIVYGVDQIDSSGMGEGFVVFGGGSVSGNKSPDLTIVGSHLLFGMSALAADVTGDGAADLYFGTIADQNVYEYLGVVGSRSSVTNSGSVQVASPAQFGSSMASLQSLASPARSDLLVGSAGAIFLYNSSATGISDPYSAMISGSGSFGTTVVVGPDWNGDGIQDIVVGNPDGNGEILLVK